MVVLRCWKENNPYENTFYIKAKLPKVTQVT